MTSDRRAPIIERPPPPDERDQDEQLELALPEWDGTLPVPYGVIPY